MKASVLARFATGDKAQRSTKPGKLRQPYRVVGHGKP
jgi:hypothetical protein